MVFLAMRLQLPIRNLSSVQEKNKASKKVTMEAKMSLQSLTMGFILLPFVTCIKSHLHDGKST